MGPPKCPRCGDNLAVLRTESLRATWAYDLNYKWGWRSEQPAYWYYCLPCHNKLRPQDFRPAHNRCHGRWTAGLLRQRRQTTDPGPDPDRPRHRPTHAPGDRMESNRTEHTTRATSHSAALHRLLHSMLVRTVCAKERVRSLICLVGIPRCRSCTVVEGLSTQCPSAAPPHLMMRSLPRTLFFTIQAAGVIKCTIPLNDAIGAPNAIFYRKKRRYH